MTAVRGLEAGGLDVADQLTAGDLYSKTRPPTATATWLRQTCRTRGAGVCSDAASAPRFAQAAHWCPVGGCGVDRAGTPGGAAVRGGRRAATLAFLRQQG